MKKNLSVSVIMTSYNHENYIKEAIESVLCQEKVDMEYATFCKESSGLRIIFHDLYILLQTAVTIIRAEGL